MTPEQSAAYVYSQTVAALIEMNGMVAENAQRQILDHSMAYTAKDFTDLIVNYGIHHNAVISAFQGAQS